MCNNVWHESDDSILIVEKPREHHIKDFNLDTSLRNSNITIIHQYNINKNSHEKSNLKITTKFIKGKRHKI
jgi:hypothetical protein